MSLNDARRFVAKMREDHDFRNKALEVSVPEDLTSFLRAEGLLFDQRELVGAMAECMAQLEQLMGRLFRRCKDEVGAVFVLFAS